MKEHHTMPLTACQEKSAWGAVCRGGGGCWQMPLNSTLFCLSGISWKCQHHSFSINKIKFDSRTFSLIFFVSPQHINLILPERICLLAQLPCQHFPNQPRMCSLIVSENNQDTIKLHKTPHEAKSKIHCNATWLLFFVESLKTNLNQ